MQSQRRNIDAIDFDSSLIVAQAEEGLDDGALASARATNDADFLARPNRDVQLMQNVLTIRVVAQREIIEFDVARGRPIRMRCMGWICGQCWLRWQMRILINTFDKCHLVFQFRCLP